MVTNHTTVEVEADSDLADDVMRLEKMPPCKAEDFLKYVESVHNVKINYKFNGFDFEVLAITRGA